LAARVRSLRQGSRLPRDMSFETYFELIRGAPTTFSHGHRD
jgi:hypothetical protein